jgi:hypothetical protein
MDERDGVAILLCLSKCVKGGRRDKENVKERKILK